MTFIRSAVAATVLLGAAMAAGPPALAATTDSPFAAFAAVCGDTRADYTAVAASADAHGWRKTEVTGVAAMPGVTVSEKISRAAKAGDAPMTLSAWKGTTKAGVQVSACTVRVTKPVFADLQSGAQAWTGFAAQESAPKKAVYRFADGPDGRKALAAADYDAAAAGAGMEILTVSSDSRGAVVDLLKIKK